MGAMREKEIIKASLVGIAGNMMLVVFKAIVGIMSHSIAIILDAVNNATDALSSILTIVGTKLAGKRPDYRHPFGYGRIEYLTSAGIAAIILIAGGISLRESIEKMMHPVNTVYSTVTITVIVIAIIAKIAIGIFFKKKGNETDSQALIASGIDSNYDAVLSAGTLVVAFAQIFFNVNIDGLVGLIISFAVLKAGIDVLKDAIEPILGERETDLSKKIYEYVKSFDGVSGAYDLILDDFGPGEMIGSLHIEVPDSMSALQIHELTRKISQGLYEKFNIVATIGIYAENSDGRFAEIRRSILDMTTKDPRILQVHGFYVDEAASTIYFDLVVDFKVDAEAVKDDIVRKISARYPNFGYNVIIDKDYEGCSDCE